MRDARRPTAASDTTRVHKHQAIVYGLDGESYFAYIGRPRGMLTGLRANILRMRNARQSDAASRSAQVSKHEGGSTCPVKVLTAGTLGPATHLRRFEGQLCECAMRGWPNRRILLYSRSRQSSRPIWSRRSLLPDVTRRARG